MVNERHPNQIYEKLEWKGIPEGLGHVILIDDVIASGAHLKACKQLIKERRHEVEVLANKLSAMLKDDTSSPRMGLRFFLLDRAGQLRPLSQREWSVLHDDLEDRRRRLAGDKGGTPPHTRPESRTGRVEGRGGRSGRHPMRSAGAQGEGDAGLPASV